MDDARSVYVRFGGRKLKIALKKDQPREPGPPKQDNSPNVLMAGGFVGQPQPFGVPWQQPRDEEYTPRGTPTGPFLKMIEEGVPVPAIHTDQEPEEEQSTEPEKTSGLETINIQYPLEFRSFSTPGVEIGVRIYYDRRGQELVYEVIEPRVNPQDISMIEEIKNYIQEKVDINFSEIRAAGIERYIDTFVDNAITYFGRRTDPSKRAALRYYVMRDFVGMGKIEPLLADKNIEDISCDGNSVNIYVYHRDPRLGSVRTNIKFDDTRELDSFANRLGERCGKTISITHPLLDGTLPDGSRVQATLASDIARRGSNFTIRMFTEKPLTPVDLIKYRTSDTAILAYCWMLIEYGKSFLVSGGTATGKTSFLNVLSLFIKPQMKIVSIEDTAELRLPHSHWVPEVSRVSVSENRTQVDMFELLKESLRQRPDYIIVGEVRGKEAYVLFQQMAVGHAGLSTIHAEDFNKLIDRLTTEPIGLPPYLMQNLDVIIFLKRFKRGRNYIRRINSLVEVIGFDDKSKAPIMDEVFAWDPKNDRYVAKNNSVALKKVAESMGISHSRMKEELEKRGKVINWMLRKGIQDFRKVGAVLDTFYASPESLMEKIEGDS
ncbi:MAG: type II/IV secretion system ATPase subunit [Candidatus Aenigmarchaeota archaeon]|nr:type II/IV secretion system ATPase subunit [Candidatus Aenigmarchaeota archaeon]